MSTEYENYVAWKKWDSHQFGAYSPQHRVYYSQQLRECGVYSLKGLSVLEIGCGSGDFAGWSVAEGATYTGTELIHELVTYAQKSGFNVHDGSLPVTSIAETESVDLIAAFDVFEHIGINDLRVFLEYLKTILKPGGVIIARVPSGDSPFARAIQNGDLTHKCVFGSSAVHQLAKETGFQVQTIRECSLPIFGLGLRTGLRRAAVCAARKFTHPIIRVLMGGGSPILTPNLVFALKK
jgi:2-polyprenyl-3-methyl-5-hydroxy-6-metoxy-1,4-benzoquinol methylase